MKMRYFTVSLAIALVFLIIFAMFGQQRLLNGTAATRVVPERLAGNGGADRTADHCLIYGKYCLGDSLRGR